MVEQVVLTKDNIDSIVKKLKSFTECVSFNCLIQGITDGEIDLENNFETRLGNNNMIFEAIIKNDCDIFQYINIIVINAQKPSRRDIEILTFGDIITFDDDVMNIVVYQKYPRQIHYIKKFKKNKREID